MPESHSLTALAKASSSGYPLKCVLLARTMHDAGWSLAAIRKTLTSEYGASPSRSTIHTWVCPEEAAKAAARTRERNAQRRTGQRPGPHHTPEARMTRLRALADVGLAAPSIAAVLNLDYGDPITRHQVKRALKTNRYPRRVVAVSSNDQTTRRAV